MRSNLIILLIFFLIILIGGNVALSFNRHDNDKMEPKTITLQESSQAEQHDEESEHDEHDDGHDDHAEGGENDKHAEDDDGHDDHAEGGEHDEHDEESSIVEMTEAQQEEIGLVISIAHPGDIRQILSLVGEVRLHEDRMAHLVPRVSGIVHVVNASLGDKVREGQVLATIDSPELAELKADYLEKLRNLELTRRTFERKEYLKQESIASEADWLEARSAFQNAETVLHSARRRLVVLGMDEKSIHNLKNSPDETFGRYELKSPLTGVVISKHITRGERISEEEVFTVADLSMVWVDLQIPAQDLRRVKEGLHIEISSTEGKVTEGKLALVGPVVDEESRTALGRVVIPNPEGNWKPGIFVKGQIHSETSSSAVVVSSDAVQNIDGENVVFVPDGDGFKAIDVALGKTVNGKTEILAGITAGTPYVSRGAFELKAIRVTSGAGGHAGHGH